MGSQENADTVRRGYDAFNAGDMDTLAAIFDDGVQWHTPGRSMMAGDYKGKDDTFAYFGRLGQETSGNFSADLKSLVASDDLVVGIHRNHGKRNGKTLEIGVSLVFRLEGGKIVEAWEHYDDLYAWDDFWS